VIPEPSEASEPEAPAVPRERAPEFGRSPIPEEDRWEPEREEHRRHAAEDIREDLSRR
jgi:hypothetical protein